MFRTLQRSLLGLSMTALLLGGCATSNRSVPMTEATAVSELSGQFKNISRADDVYFAGYPTEAGLADLKARGVDTIISLKTADQVTEATGMDEQAVARDLGMKLIYLPISPDSFSAKDVEKFSKLMNQHQGPVLVHCGSANTAAGLWAAYLNRKMNVSEARALELGEAAGLNKPEMVEATKRVMAE